MCRCWSHQQPSSSSITRSFMRPLGTAIMLNLGDTIISRLRDVIRWIPRRGEPSIGDGAMRRVNCSVMPVGESSPGITGTVLGSTVIRSTMGLMITAPCVTDAMPRKAMNICWILWSASILKICLDGGAGFSRAIEIASINRKKSILRFSKT